MAAPWQPASAALGLVRRDDDERCVECDTTKTLVCPQCEEGVTECQFIYPVSCGECPRATCVPVEPGPSSPGKSGGSTNVGGIIGGVVGGIAALAIMTYLLWRFCVRTRRQAAMTEPWDDGQDQGLEGEKTFARRRDCRASTHTTHSIASTVLTRASNIIQIAYIPGVTNRATPSPSVLVPPVPRIPGAMSQAGARFGTGDERFFVPGDLRDSTYSGLSSLSDRTSFARTSYAPRSSVASTVYGKSAVVVAPAQTGMRAKPAMVSVKPSHSNPSTAASTPPVPAVDYGRYNLSPRPPSPANSTFSVGSTFLNNASTTTATPARAMIVRVCSKKGGPQRAPKPVAPDADSGADPTASGTSLRDSSAPTLIVDSPAADQSPFRDPPKSAAQSTTSLSAVIEEATRRASQRDSTLPPRERGRSPFGDEHATS
ncbi:hypothetical protein VTH06DRAFT_6175 [Thermothelomyces fergusii]